MENLWTELRSSQLTEQCFWLIPGRTHRRARLQSWVAPVARVVGRALERRGPGSKGDRKNVASKQTASGEGLHAFRDDDLTGNPGCGRSRLGRDARGLAGLHAGFAIRFHRAAESRRSGRSDLHRQIYK